MSDITQVVPLAWPLLLGAALFGLGVFGALRGKLVGVALLFGAVALTLATFWRYAEPQLVAGQSFAVAALLIGAAHGVAWWRLRATGEDM